MKTVLKKAKSFIRILYTVLPFFLGVYCYYPVFLSRGDSRYPFLDAVYGALRLYSGSTESGVEVGIVLQFARFLALAATLSILIRLFDKTTALINRLKLCMAQSTVVYGDSQYADYLYESLPVSRRIRGSDRFIGGASRYLLMFSDETENIAFYHAHYERLQGKSVYLMLNDVSKLSVQNPRITVFSIAESCARQYWRKYPVFAEEKIAILGFGSVGQNILLYGLQVNLIDPCQHFAYHIYGDSAEFEGRHTQLDKMTPDEVVFHGSKIDYAQLADCDRIILCGEDGDGAPVRALSDLFLAVPLRHPVYVYAPKGDIISDLFGKERVVCFGTEQEVASIDAILNQKFMEAARRQHTEYAARYGGASWEELDNFARYSNVSSSDYMFVTERLIESGMPDEKLAQLEHIRWCRYHYLNNWAYAPVTDKSRRLHNCLIPFAELPEEEKKKDIEAIAAKRQ